MDDRPGGGGRRASAVALTVAAAFAAAACHGTPSPPPPTTLPSASSTTTPPLTAEQVRCLAEGTFLADVGTQLSRIVLSEGATPGSADEQLALAAALAQRDRLNGRAVHPPYIADRAGLIDDVTNIIEGNQGLLGPGHHSHAQRKRYYQQVSNGGNAALTHAADAKVKRSACAPGG